MSAAPLRLAVLPDFREEGWPSMDLCADMLLTHLPPSVAATVVRPAWRRVAARVPSTGRAGFNADRLLNRHVLYPRALRGLAGRFDCLHVVDHSYAHLTLSLPSMTAGVYCHDVDAFRSVFDPSVDPRPRWFRALARRTLAGLRRASVVFVNSAVTADDLRRHRLCDPGRVRVVPLGVAPEFTAVADKPGPAWLNELGTGPVLLHVGSCIPRKRVDVLLDVAAAVRARVPGMRLLKVGGEFTPAQHAQVERLNLGSVLTHRVGLTRGELAAAYRRAGVVLVTSESEGFGLPVIEALACGARVVASDIPVLREAGGPSAVYAPVADVSAWADAVAGVLAADPAAGRAGRLAWAANFTWAKHAAAVAAAYCELAGRPCG